MHCAEAVCAQMFIQMFPGGRWLADPHAINCSTHPVCGAPCLRSDQLASLNRVRWRDS